jgi:hypothetical protein
MLSDSDPVHPGVARLIKDGGIAEALEILSTRISGADLTSLLLQVTSRRAKQLQPKDVLAQYQRDRFVTPSTSPFQTMRKVEDIAIANVEHGFEFVITSPVVPIGTHSVVAEVHQNNVVSTVRGSEVNADATNALALEAAIRRKGLLASNGSSHARVHLAAIQRVVRAQQFEGPKSFPHFNLLGLVSAGRDDGNSHFEVECMMQHIRTHTEVLQRCGAESIAVRVTDFTAPRTPALARIVQTLERENVTVEAWPERTAARGYYPSLCFDITATFNGESIEVSDGGIVPWTQRLLQNQKERLMISGMGLERIAMVFDINRG